MLDISHATLFNYAQPVSLSHQLLRLEPREHARQRLVRTELAIEPAPAAKLRRRDYFGNQVTYVTVQEPHEALRVFARSRVEVEPPNPAYLDFGPTWEEVVAELAAPRQPEPIAASQFVFTSPYVDVTPAVYTYAVQSFPRAARLIPSVLDLSARINAEFSYEGGVTDVWTPVAEVLARRRGVCQDFAHLAIACLRSLGIAARYVSGYLLTRPPEGRERLVGADASHAWLSVWCPHVGWVDIDPTNNVVPSDEHVSLAWGRDYGDVSPTTGVIVGGGRHTVSVAVDVVRVDGSGRTF
jgi:transglutaminase-like putative cysteine protease